MKNMKNRKNKTLALYLLATMMLVLTLTACGLTQTPAPPAPAPNTASRATPVSNPAVFDLIEVPIRVQGADQVGSVEFELAYDEAALEATGVKKGPLAANAMIEFSIDTPGRVWAGIVDANGMSGDGALAVISFRAVGEGQQATPLTLENISAHHATTFLDIPPDPSEGSFLVADGTVTPPSLKFSQYDN